MSVEYCTVRQINLNIAEPIRTLKANTSVCTEVIRVIRQWNGNFVSFQAN